MRLRSFALIGWSLVLLLILWAVTFSFVRMRPMGASIAIHSYQHQGDELFACLVLTNTGAVSLAVPVRFGCQVDKVSGFTNYIVDTRYTVFLQPRQHVILSNALWRVRLPADTSAWKVNIQIRQMSGRERFVDALRQSGLMNYRTLSRLQGQPKKEADYQWLECGSDLLEVPAHYSEGSTVIEDE
jgi:hypothetical protein